MRTLSRSLAGILTLLLPLGLFASPAGTRNDGKRPVRLSETTEILGTSLPRGSYDLRWTRESGSEIVRLEVTRGKTVLATGTGVWASAGEPSPHEALVFRSAGGGNELSEVRFRNSAERILVHGGREIVGPTADAGR